MPFDDLITVDSATQTWLAGLGALTGIALLLVLAARLRATKEHRATLLVANVLTVVAAALATMVSASGMWKFFTDILGPSPLRYAFFGFIETALFASALLARSRLLREPEKGATGVDGIAVWVLAGLTATLSALDSDNLREVCLRLVAPLVAAWMWERALAAERHVRLGATGHRINWTLAPARILVWLHLAEPRGRDVSEVDQARRRARLGRARLHLYLLDSRSAAVWRVRRAHRHVIRQAMHAAEHIGLADHPDAANEREAIQMYMATLYGFIDATTPQAVAHLNAWQTIRIPQHRNTTNAKGTPGNATTPAVPVGNTVDQRTGTAGTTQAGTASGSKPAAVHGSEHTERDDHVRRNDTASAPAGLGLVAAVSGLGAGQAGATHHHQTPTGAVRERAPHTTNRAATDRQLIVPLPAHRADRLAGQHAVDRIDPGQLSTLDIAAGHVGEPGDGPPNQAQQPDPREKARTGDQPGKNDLGPHEVNEKSVTPAVAAMRRFWDTEVAKGRIPSGAELSRAAGVPPTTGLGRRKRREWQADLAQQTKTIKTRAGNQMPHDSPASAIALPPTG